MVTLNWFSPLRGTGGDISSRAGRNASGEARRLVALCLVLALLGMVGCNPLAEPDCPDGSDQFVEYQLFMGRGGESGEVVSDAGWAQFLADSVTPRFPDGLTVLDGQGQWRNAAGQVERERSKVLILFAAAGDQGKIDAISSEYEIRFGQESVLRVVGEACVSFS